MKYLALLGFIVVLGLSMSLHHEPRLQVKRLETGLQPISRTRATWAEYGSLGRLKNLPINLKDLAGLNEETEIKNSLANHRFEDTRLIDYADRYRASNSSIDLRRLLIAISALSGDDEKLTKYSGGGMGHDFGLPEYIAFRRTLGAELSVIEAKLLIVWDNKFFGNPTETFHYFKNLEVGGFADRETSFSVINKVAESFMTYHKNDNLVVELCDLAEKLYSERKSQQSTYAFGTAMMAKGILKDDKETFNRGLSMIDFVFQELAHGDAFERQAYKGNMSYQSFWVKKGKELFN
jgi:hypothetical protein